MTENLNKLQGDAIDLLKKLIATPSFSTEENKTADIIENFFSAKGIKTERLFNNIWVKNKYYDERKIAVLLNSHHDTVRPNKRYTVDPFCPIVQRDSYGEKLLGLGSNDAGGALVSLIAAFLYYYDRDDMRVNFILAATAEEEISGRNGIEKLLQQKNFAEALGYKKDSIIGLATFGIVGEPTKMQMAVAERGLLVLDCIAEGKAGHAAREEGDNAIYKAINDIEWFESFKFPKISELLGAVKMSVTSIETENKQHNITPPQCTFVVDVRINELYTFEEVLQIIQENVQCKIQPRSTRLRSTSIALDHPLVKTGLALGRNYYGSPTTSDKALMPFETLKIGPGDSARSHIADEFIYLDEIKEGIEIYIKLMEQL